MKKILYSLLFVFLTIKYAMGNLSDDMNKFWNKLGGTSNSNSAYASQSAGYYTGGSINARVPVIQERPFNIQAPKITAGCGGIDMFTGSFSHINLDRFVEQAKAIASNAVGYAFQLGLETLSPKIANVMERLQEVIDQINSININSCESAKLLVDGVAGKSITVKESMCAQMALISGSASDADAAKGRCKSQASQVAENNKMDDEQKFTNINFTWQALKKDGYVNSLGQETSEAFMSMVGTIIYRDNTDPQFITPTIFNAENTSALINGGSIRIKKCDNTNDCLSLTEQEVSISNNTAFKPKIRPLLQSMQDKIRNSANNGANDNLTDAEKSLIGQTSIPILRIMINTATGQSPIDIETLSELVARQILNEFFSGISSSIRQQLVSLELKNNNKDALDILAKNMDLINEYLKLDREKLMADFKQLQEIIDINEKIDRQLASQYSEHIKAVLDFSNSLANGGK